MDIKLIPRKQIFYNFENNYRVFSCTPIDPPPDFELNDYGNFTIAGTNLSSFKVGQETEATIRQNKDDRYPASYVVVGIPELKSIVNVSPKANRIVLNRLMEPIQADRVLAAYPDFVGMVLRGEEEEIDCKNIYNVGEVRIESYIEKVKAECNSVLFYPIADDWKMNDKDIQQLTHLYPTPKELEDTLEKNPYFVLIAQTKWGFNKADKLVLSKHPELRDSLERCTFSAYAVLQENELEGDTRINANLLAALVKEKTPECVSHIVEAVSNSQVIYYDPETKYSSLMETYNAEKFVAKTILDRVNTPIKDDMNWEDFKVVDGFETTEEQQEILKLANSSSVMMLTGSAGCVDCDTEFFTGHGWKRIADYQQGDKVLQYNEDGTANLVEPLDYIQLPCDKLWHFETKYGVNQTVCDAHRIVYWSAKNKQHECQIQDIIQAQSDNGWRGRFKTTFNYNGKGINLTDDEIRLMCAVSADGSLYSDHLCRFHLKKDRKKDRLRQLLSKANIPWTEHKSVAPNYVDFYLEPPIWQKEFTEEWYNCNHHQLEIICDEVLYWDGSISYTKTGKMRKQYSTTIKSNADFIQFAYSACGYRATIWSKDRSGQKYFTCGKWYTRKSIEYTVSITSRNMVGLCADTRLSHKMTQVASVPTIDGYKYCFTVPSSYLVLRRNNCIFVTGNCGKTAAVKALIRMLEANGKTYTLLAPTGVAAKRLKESTGRFASTIHLFVARENPIGDFLVIDEFSMAGIHILAQLFHKLPAQTKIVFVCDNAQLASISCGNMVQDILDSGVVPIAKLTKIFRYGIGGIATIATDIRQGNPKSIESTFSDYHFYPIDNPYEQIIDIYQHYLDQGYTQKDIMVLCPYNKSKIGTYAINNIIQQTFNAHPYTGIEYKKDGCTIRFKVGDKVIQKRNNYNIPTLEYNEDGDLVDSVTKPIVNGDIGTIISYRNDEQCKQLIVEFDSCIAKIEGADITDVLLGGCISIHSSQGSQAPVVIAIVDKSHKNLLSNNLLYVAVSRAQKDLTVIGDSMAIESSLDIHENMERDTWLKEMLMKEVK